MGERWTFCAFLGLVTYPPLFRRVRARTHARARALNRALVSRAVNEGILRDRSSWRASQKP